jgi:hypothetical protein
MSETTRSPHIKDVPKKVEGPGPFLAVVRNHLDTEYMGQLEVELLKTNSEGNTTDATGEVVPVSYLSPFYGVTPYNGVTENEGFDYTQKSYGFWAVPPDVGTKVLVIFAEGNRGRGYWIGCVQDSNMNFMVPGNASTTYNSEDKGKPRPVGEYNKKTEDGVGNDPTQYIKPCNPDHCAILDGAGLADDPIRGTTTSSARRDLPSMVFGWSSPGPLDRRDGKPTVPYGEKGKQINIKSSRMTGTTIVMDDGDPTLFRKGPARGPDAVPSEYTTLAKGGNPGIPFNELFRIRTRTGHQILLHNAEDLIYIAHGSGDSWIEMTANGKIDIYSKDSVSIHTENDFNFKADRDINIEAGQNINIKAGNQMMIETVANWEVKVGADGKLTCVGNSNIKSKHHFETADRIDMNGSTKAAEAGNAPIPTRVPKRGSWTGQENKNPLEHIPEKTESDPEKIKKGTANGNSDDKNKEKAPDDTFKKCPPAEEESIVDDDPVADSTVETSNATLSENGQTQPASTTTSSTTTTNDGTTTTTSTSTSTTTESITSGGKAVLIGNDGQVIPEATAPKQISVGKNSDGQIISRTVEVQGVDEDGFAYTQKKVIKVDPVTGKDIVKPVSNVDTSAIDAETAAFEAEFDAQEDGQST